MKSVSDGSPTAHFGDNARNDLVRARAGILDFNTRKALFENRQDRIRRGRRQSPIKIQCSTFLQRFLIGLIQGFSINLRGIEKQRSG
jgi:hypothetical protein